MARLGYKVQCQSCGRWVAAYSTTELEDDHIAWHHKHPHPLEDVVLVGGVVLAVNAGPWCSGSGFQGKPEWWDETEEVSDGALAAELLSDEGSLEDSDGEPDTHNDAASSP